ncbi:hypothetical protein PV403_12930 [Paenibacillus sp. GYB006]|uniref:nucleotidyltransferase domain-containing protein n=1 Tax=Paenibacillus sp. GYB006 TaxID=2994394 RepID=UPI002F966EE8
MEKIISQACSFLSGHGFDWSICGGTAIDIFLSKQTRIHKDLDVAVFWEDRNAIIELMLGAGWRVFEACGGGVVLELNKIQDTPFEKRNLFCFSANEDRVTLEPIEHTKYRFELAKSEQKEFTYVEFLFNERDETSIHLPGKTKIKRELIKAILSSPDDVPYLAPEIVLYYKSSYLKGVDAADHNHDFDISLPYFTKEQNQWLREALQIRYHNGHPWLERMNEPLR